MRRVLPALIAAACVAAGPVLAADDPGRPKQWGLEKVGASSGWARASGSGIVVAVVDTGVDLTHEDLKDKLTPPGTWRDLVDNDASPDDGNGHGSHVAGIAAAATGNGRGVAGTAPQAKIMPVRVLNEFGVNLTLSPELLADTAEGIRWAVDHGAHVINLSVGSPTGAATGSPFADALKYAWDRQVICVVAAGNDSQSSSGYRDELALVVSATDRNDRLAGYSNGVGAAKWGMAAPGGAGSTFGSETEDIFSTYLDNTYTYLSGTSMAAPFVSGAAALLRSRGKSPQETVDTLLRTAKDLGAPGRDTAFGAGRLDVAAATAGLNPLPTNSGGGTTTGGVTPPPAQRKPASSNAPAAPRASAAARTPAPATAEGQTPAPATEATQAPAERGFAAPRRSGGSSSPVVPLATGAAALAMGAGGAWGLHRLIARRS